MRLKDKVVLVTASSRGIGLAIVKACAKEGARVYMAVRNLKNTEELIKNLDCEKGKIKSVYFNASEKETAKTMVDKVVEKEGRIDVLVNNFGLSNPEEDLDIINTNYDNYIQTIDMNLSSVFISSQTAIAHMQKRGGAIVNISSLSGSVPELSRIAYGTSKAAINYMTKQIAIQSARMGVRCNAIMPGVIETDGVKNNLPKEYRLLLEKHIPIDRIGKPSEIADAVVYFASDDALYTTGQILEVSGGFGQPTPIYGELLFANRD